MSDLIHDLVYARNYVRDHGVWLVVVVPDNLLTQGLQLLSAVADPDQFSGRTALIGDKGGHLSLVGVSTPFFLPQEQSFEVLFLGWGSALDSKGMDTWRKKARREIRRF